MSEPEVVTLTDTAKPRTFARLLSDILHRRATWVLIDQGIVSAGDFLMGNLLGRTLTQAHYGIFGLLLETMLYLNGLQAALVIYPLLIKGATGKSGAIARLATVSTIFTVALLPLLGAAIGLSVALSHVAAIAIAAIAAMFLWQLQETLRRALIADLRFSEAVWGDGISYLGQAVVVFVLRHLNLLTLNTALIAMAVTSAAAIVLQAMQVGLVRVTLHDITDTAREFWRLGRWMLLNNAGAVVSTLGYWWTLNWSHGAAECGIFTAIVQMFKLANPVSSSMSNLIVPAVARVASREGPRAARKTAIKYILFGAILLSPYFLGLAVFPTTALRLFYRADSPYVQYGTLLRLFVANYTMVYLATVIGAWLSGLGHSRLNFYAQLANMTASVLIGLPFTYLWGAKGMIIGGLFSAVVVVAGLAWFIHYANTHPSTHFDPVAPQVAEPPTV